MFSTRPMQPEDDAVFLRIIQDCVREFGYDDSPYLHDADEQEIYSYYQRPRCAGYVVEDDRGVVIGGGGFAPVEGAEHLCEIMQVYFAPRARGYGLGKRLVQQLMCEAEQYDYAGFYIETVPEMQAAIGLYRALGFTPLPQRMGTGGHNVCSVFMHLPLHAAADKAGE